MNKEFRIFAYKVCRNLTYHFHTDLTLSLSTFLHFKPINMKLRKFILTAACGLLSWAGVSAATVFMHTPGSYQIMAVSPNGLWACGAFVDGSGNPYGFRWNLSSGSIEMLSVDGTSIGWDVADDGTVSGQFCDSSVLPNHAPIEFPGYYRDGKWHSVERPSDSVIDGVGAAITPDGQYMTGALLIDGIYKPVIWKDGKISRIIDCKNHAIAYAISPDGQSAAGYLTQKNRTNCYWPASGDPVLFEDSPTHSQTPWSFVRNFSPNGSKFVYWGGWGTSSTEDEYGNSLYCIYDIATGQRTKLEGLSIDSNLEFYDIDNNGTAVGTELDRGVVYYNNQKYYIDDYLEMRGVNINDFDDFYSGSDFTDQYKPIFRVQSISADGNILALLYYNTVGFQSSMIIKMDQNVSAMAPAEVKASQLQGLNSVEVKWSAPVGATGIKGYNIYRDGQKLNGVLPINGIRYFDKNVAEGNRQYTVAAVNMQNQETKAQPLSVTVKAPSASAPFALFSRQKGINDAHVSWAAPSGKVIKKGYFNPDIVDNFGFSVYEPLTMEGAIRFDKGELACYSGYKIEEVSFTPLSPMNGWKVNIYTVGNDGALSRIFSQTINQELEYKQLNTVKLSSPVDIPSQDLIVAIEVDVQNSSEVMAAQMGPVTPGYSDLLRKSDEPKFYSAFDNSLESGYSFSCMSWCISLGLAPAGHSYANDKVSAYYIYLDGSKKAETSENTILLTNLANGNHNVEVEAKYADGTVSGKASTDLSIAKSYPTARDLTIEGTDSKAKVNISWNAPVNDDMTKLSYTSALSTDKGIKGPAANSYALAAAVKFEPSKLRGYNGYKVKNLRFYPMTDAIYTFYLYKDSELVYEYEVMDFTPNMWNAIEVDEEIIIDEKSTYQLMIDCFDPVPEEDVLGVDNMPAFAMTSDLFSIDGGESWNSLEFDTGLSANWLLDMTIVAPSSTPVQVEGYDVVIDNKKRNEAKLTDTNFEYDFKFYTQSKHSVSVSTYYPGESEPVNGEVTIFRLTSGVDDAIAEIEMEIGENYITIEAEKVDLIQVVAIDGKIMASTNERCVNITSLPAGIYVVRAIADGKEVVRKVNIK